MKLYFNYIFNLLIFLTLIEHQGKIFNVTIPIGRPVVPNECGSLGNNNPLRLLDCSIFKLQSGLCCLLTITTKENETECEDDLCSNEELFRTACIILEKKDSKIINKTSMNFKSYGDVLIECSHDYISNSIIFISMLIFFFLF